MIKNRSAPHHLVAGFKEAFAVYSPEAVVHSAAVFAVVLGEGEDAFAHGVVLKRAEVHVLVEEPGLGGEMRRRNSRAGILAVHPGLGHGLSQGRKFCACQSNGRKNHEFHDCFHR